MTFLKSFKSELERSQAYTNSGASEDKTIIGMDYIANSATNEANGYDSPTSSAPTLQINDHHQLNAINSNIVTETAATTVNNRTLQSQTTTPTTPTQLTKI